MAEEQVQRKEVRGALSFGSAFPSKISCFVERGAETSAEELSLLPSLMLPGRRYLRGNQPRYRNAEGAGEDRIQRPEEQTDLLKHSKLTSEFLID